VVCPPDAPGLLLPPRFVLYLILELSFWRGLFALPSSFEGQVGVSGHKPSFCPDVVIILVSPFISFRPLMEVLSPLVKGSIWGPPKGSLGRPWVFLVCLHVQALLFLSFRFLLSVRLGS
jgi:hypothetical protein